MNVSTRERVAHALWPTYIVGSISEGREDVGDEGDGEDPVVASSLRGLTLREGVNQEREHGCGCSTVLPMPAGARATREGVMSRRRVPRPGMRFWQIYIDQRAGAASVFSLACHGRGTDTLATELERGVVVGPTTKKDPRLTSTQSASGLAAPPWLPRHYPRDLPARDMELKNLCYKKIYTRRHVPVSVPAC